ncbi:MAG: hypothetical protein WCT85_06755 [Parachlamydiales bacterium]|jgi:hypothetical protein
MRYLTKLLFALAFLIAFNLYPEDRIESGSRHLSEKENEELLEQQKNTVDSDCYKEYPYNYTNKLLPLIYNQWTHKITGVSVLGDYLVIEDGSEWKINPQHSYIAFSWRETDPILIVVNSSFFSSYFYGYKYKMINAKTDEQIEVKLDLGPVLGNPSTLQITEVNFLSKEVSLNDNSIWKLSPSQGYILEKWLPGDGIIVGTNTKNWRNHYENILINVNMLTEIKCNKVKR